MSLLVWLPMTKDLSDQGLGGCTITNEGATLDNNGKLGKCYNFDGTNDKIQVSGLNNPKNITVAFWMKRNATTNTRQFLFTAWGGVSIELGAANNLFGKVAISGGEAGGASGGTVTADSGWIHVCYTFEDKVGGKMYINGVLTGSGDTTSSIAWTTTSGYIGNYSNIYLNAKLNDFRIYDYALSPKEIEILSRGLVCHYPLNGGGRGGDNLLKNTADLTLWTKEAGITTTWDSEKNMYKIEDSAHTNSRWGIYQDINVEANTSYTITVTLDGTACGAGFAVYDSSTSFPPAVIGTTGRQSYTLTSGANSTKARIYLYTNCGVSKVAWFSLPKVEKGDKSTPWMPNPADTEYAKMGYDSTTTYDCSGYQNNATSWAYDNTGSIDISSDTARYSVSTFINSANPSSSQAAGTCYIYGNCILTKPEKLTLAFWCKPITGYGGSTVHGVFSLTNNDIGQNAGADYQSGPLNHRDYGFDVNGISGSTYVHKRLSIDFTANQWHHYVVTYDGRYAKMYKDAIQVSSADMEASIPLGDMKGIVIGFSKAGGAWRRVQSYYSDVRLYATALSAEQVAELYNTAVSVANNGTLMSYELVEV